MTAVVVVAVIIINLIVNSFGIKADLTKNKLYTLSEDTITLLKNLDEDVSVTSVYEEGNEISVVKEILNKYASYSKHITVNNVDPYTNPSFATKYAKNGDKQHKSRPRRPHRERNNKNAEQGENRPAQNERRSQEGKDFVDAHRPPRRRRPRRRPKEDNKSGTPEA